MIILRLRFYNACSGGSRGGYPPLDVVLTSFRPILKYGGWERDSVDLSGEGRCSELSSVNQWGDRVLAS